MLTRRRAFAMAAVPLLARTAVARERTVAIIGAGIAGLAAGRSLADAGYTVAIFEARTRIGGRIHGMRCDGLTLEMGANWIHGDQGNPLVRLARTAGIETRPTDFDDWTVLDAEGSTLRASGDDRIDPLYDWIEKRLDEADGDTLADAIGDGPRSVRRDARLRALWDALVDREIAADYGAEPRELSPDLYELGDGFDGDDLLVTNGYGRIPDLLAKGLDIRLGHAVTRLSHDATAVRIEGAWGLADFSHAVVTLPLGVLKSGAVSFEPPLSRRKTAAIAGTGVAVFEKAFLLPDRPFRFPSVHVTVTGDNPWRHLFDISAIAGRPAVLAYCGGDSARRANLSDDAANREWMLQAVRLACGDPDLAAADWLRSNWGTDAFARGSYSFPGPDSEADDIGVLAASEGRRLHFAGEAASRYWGTVHGAYLSGVDAAKRIVEAG